MDPESETDRQAHPVDKTRIRIHSGNKSRIPKFELQYMDGSIKEDVKYKVVEQDVESGKAVVIS